MVARARAPMLSIAVVAALLAGAARAAPPPSCAQAGREAEANAGLPPGLLQAVGRVESGRWNPRQGRVVSWPWTIDVAGQGRFFPDKAEAVRTTEALLQSGQRNIDVGCFQISLLHHPSAFADLGQAFDPVVNGQYAAQFLLTLRGRYGNWADAVAAYHSADPALGNPYRDLVFAVWRPDASGVSRVPGVRVWTPSPIGSAPQVISLQASGPHLFRLPRVVMPSG